jgi:hypothetical protein
MKFPVWRTTLDAFAFLWRHRDAVVRYGSLPLALNILATFAITASGIEEGYATALSSLAYLVIYVPVTIAWYRLTVLGSDAIKTRPVFKFGRPEWRLFWWQVLVLVVIVVVFLITGAVFVFLTTTGKLAGYELPALIFAGTLMAIVVLAVGLFATRLSLAMVVVALDSTVSLGSSWRMAEGASGRTLAAAVLVGVVGAVLTAPIEILKFVAKTEESSPDALSYVALIGQDATGLLTLLALSTVFGLIYRMLMEHATPETIAAEVAP